jgi:hypothetical protein
MVYDEAGGYFEFIHDVDLHACRQRAAEESAREASSEGMIKVAKCDLKSRLIAGNINKAAMVGFPERTGEAGSV